jgi:hypothetical protein
MEVVNRSMVHPNDDPDSWHFNVVCNGINHIQRVPYDVKTQPGDLTKTPTSYEIIGQTSHSVLGRCYPLSSFHPPLVTLRYVLIIHFL